jgi:hypothetical protein
MSKILWKQTLLPDVNAPTTDLVDESYKDQVPNVRTYPKASNEMGIPDAKAFRSMSRASVFLSHICQLGHEAMAPFLAKSPYSLGIYCAVENGPIDGPSTVKILAQDAAAFAESYRKFRNPKMYLKQLPNLVPAQMGISLGLQGAMNVYTHSRMASLQALDQAEWDLKTGVVEAALVCTAHAFDDFLVVKRTRTVTDLTISEGAAAALLVADGELRDWKQNIPRDGDNFFGISDQMIQLLK